MDDDNILFTDKDFHYLAHALRERTGIVLADHKKIFVYSRLYSRLKALNLNNFSHYCHYLEGAPCEDEWCYIINALTTNLTRFFREKHHFDYLQEYLVSFKKRYSQPHLLSFKPSLRIWSAGCASGEEAYSIAMVVSHSLGDLSCYDVKILASDINTHVLARACQGLYDKSQKEDIPTLYHDYLEDRGDCFRINDALLSMVSFGHVNLIQDWPMTKGFDIIFCRNVIIYFDAETQKIFFKRLAHLLHEDGFLCVGHSENIMMVSDAFKPLGQTIYSHENSSLCQRIKVG